MDDFELAPKKEYNISCCRSYLTPRGRCFSCPEEDSEGEDGSEEE